MREILRGSLADVSLPSLLQLLEAEATTGWLQLQPAGRLGVHQGRPVAAELGPVTGVAALLDLFTAPATTFSVQADDGVQGAPLGDMLGFVLEGCRLSDEWNRLSGRVLAPVDPAPGDAPDDATSDSLQALLPFLDGQRTVADAVAACALARSVVLDPLLAALEAGHLRELSRPAAPRRQAAPLPQDYGAALQRGRTLLRADRFEDAEAAFARALALRPGDRIAAQNLRRARQLRTGAHPAAWWTRSAS